MGEIVRWETEPLVRPRRGLDERLRLWFPGLSAAMSRAAMRRAPGSRMRRAALTRAVRVGWAATNRDDYAGLRLAYADDAEFYPPSLGHDALGFDPVYRGPEGVERFTVLWKSGFERFVYEPREIADAGGDRFGVRLGMIATMPGSDVEIREEYGAVLTLRDGLVVRHDNFRDWDAALAALAATDDPVGTAAAEP